MRVTVTFHGPFRVATGSARRGVAATVGEDLLPASSLKGLMRHSAEQLLPETSGLVDLVFGGGGNSSPWSWSSAQFAAGEPTVVKRARIAIDEESGSARRDHLLLGDEVWATEAEFTVDRYARLPHSSLDEDGHLTVLACAAAGVHSLGANRRRGLGWVTCTPGDPSVDSERLSNLRRIAARWEPSRAS